MQSNWVAFVAKRGNVAIDMKLPKEVYDAIQKGWRKYFVSNKAIMTSYLILSKNNKVTNSNHLALSSLTY